MKQTAVYELAKTAKFQMGFGIMMLSCGRTDEASSAFEKLERALDDIMVLTLTEEQGE